MATTTVCVGGLAVARAHVWTLANNGYATRWLYKQRPAIELLHRAILRLTDRKQEGDHINRDRLDNRLSNLRVTTRRLNAQNRTGNRGRPSKLRNVTWDSKKALWRVKLYVGRHQRVSLGYYRTEEEAIAAAAAGRQRLMPFSPEASGFPLTGDG